MLLGVSGLLQLNSSRLKLRKLPTVQYITAHCTTVRNVVQHSTVESSSKMHYSTLHYSPELQSVMQYSTVQSSAVQCVSKLVNPKPVMTLTHHGCRQQQLTSLPKAQPPRASAGAATTHTCVGRCCYSPHVRRQVLLLPVWQWRQQQPLPVSRTLQDVETIKP